MKMADVTPVYKKDSPSVKDNHCPVSILPNLSKIFERCFCKQVSPYFDNILSKNDCGFRKNYSAEIAGLYYWKNGRVMLTMEKVLEYF